MSEGMRYEARLAHDACDFDIDYVFDLDDCLEDFGIEELAFDLEPAAYIEEFRRQQFVRSIRSMLPLPAALGAIRLTSVEDEVLERHAHAYLASCKDLLLVLLTSIVFRIMLRGGFSIGCGSHAIPSFG